MRTRKLAMTIAIASVAVLGAWALFRPELAFVNKSVNETLVAGKTLKMGTFTSLAHETTGSAEIVQDGDGYALQLKDFKTSNGPDVRVYLVSDRDAAAGTKAGKYVDLGSIKGNVGNQRYRLPAGTTPDSAQSIAIWCARFNVGFGQAALASG